MQIITSTGFGDSGSSAITDLLSEYEGIKSYGSEWECTFLHMPGGLGDLENAVSEGHRLKTDYAIKQFLKLSKKLSQQEMYKKAFKNQFYIISIDFIESFFKIKWKGMYEDIQSDFLSELSFNDKKFIDFSSTYYTLNKSKKFDMYESDSWRPSYIPYTDMYYSCDLDGFYSAAKKYTKSLFNIAAEGAERLFLDQLLPPISTQKYVNYIEYETKVFIVDKDPRDLFLVEKLFNGSRFIPFEDINVFINWYKQTREKSYETKDSGVTYHCLLNELIQNYDAQCKKIEAFLKIDSNLHKAKLEKFNPEKSAVNINLFLKYNNYSDEINKITKELSDFLYKENHLLNTPVLYENPIASVLNECNQIQNKKISKNKLKLIFMNTYLIKNIMYIKYRKSLSKKIKALIKSIFGLIIFIVELLINTILIIRES